MFTVLINKLKSILDANEQIQESYEYDVEEFKGDPVATIVPSNNESDYDTTDENIRIYAYNITLYVNRTVRTKKKADEVLRDLVSSVIDDFDKDYTLTGIEVPIGYTFINLFAAPSTWGYAGREDEYRVAEINLRCRVNIDINQIT